MKWNDKPKEVHFNDYVEEWDSKSFSGSGQMSKMREAAHGKWIVEGGEKMYLNVAKVYRECIEKSVLLCDSRMSEKNA